MRRVVVTGGGTGIGLAIAQRFAASDAEVHIIGRRKDVLDRAAASAEEGRIHPLVADLTSIEDLQQVVDTLSEAPVDVLVNNAGGILKGRDAGLGGTVAHYRRTIESNLLTAMALTEALWSNLARPGGRVVNISSIAAQRGGGDAYAAAKSGLFGWAFGLAKKGGADGITVNTVSPGYVQDTEFFNAEGRSPRHDQLVSEVPLGRAGRPADIAGAVHFLASEDASWITGQVLSVNGGALMG
ncbi:SDR family oxidoreductase [Glycomyces halotolerans]